MEGRKHVTWRALFNVAKVRVGLGTSRGWDEGWGGKGGVEGRRGRGTLIRATRVAPVYVIDWLLVDIFLGLFKVEKARVVCGAQQQRVSRCACERENKQDAPYFSSLDCLHSSFCFSLLVLIWLKGMVPVCPWRPTKVGSGTGPNGHASKSCSKSMLKMTLVRSCCCCFRWCCLFDRPRIGRGGRVTGKGFAVGLLLLGRYEGWLNWC